jgi:hypothetical protein
MEQSLAHFDNRFSGSRFIIDELAWHTATSSSGPQAKKFMAKSSPIPSSLTPVVLAIWAAVAARAILLKSLSYLEST